MKKLVMGLAVSLLAGCAIHDAADVAVIQQPQAVHQSLDTLSYSPLAIYDDGVKQVIPLTGQSPVVRLDGGQSSALGWKIPAYGVYRFKLTSQIQRAKFGREASAFMAEVRLLDKEFNVVKTLPAEAMAYQKPGLMEPEYFYHRFVVDNRDPLLAPVEYIAVVMTDRGRQHQIKVVDQEKEYAKVRGTLPPMTGDILATASEHGVIVLEAMAAMSSYAPSDAPAPAYMPPVETGRQTAVIADTTMDTVAISRTYREAVEDRLAAGDVVAALAMRDHVDALHQELQADFAALYQSGSSTMIAVDDAQSMDLPQQLSAAYKNQLVTSFKAGNARQALGLLDQAKKLRQHVDSLFRLSRSSK